MKAKSSIIGFAVMLLATAWTAPAPNVLPEEASIVSDRDREEGDFSFFRVHRQGKGVTATWGVGTTSGIVGFLVQKTYEDPNDEYAYWEDVISLPNNGSRSLKYTDTNVFPGYINYRIIALKTDGSSVSSGIATARIVSH